jgi:hypothetical protein
MYRRRILCTLHIAVEFEIFLYKYTLYRWVGQIHDKGNWKGWALKIETILSLEMATHEHKINNVLYGFVWCLDFMIFRGANLLLRPLEGVGPCNGFVHIKPVSPAPFKGIMYSNFSCLSYF